VTNRCASTRNRVRNIAAGLGAGFLLVLPAGADSGLTLAYPAVFGTIPASTFDAGQRRVGDANLVIEKLDNGNVRMLSESGIEGGARTVATVELVPVGDGTQLRPLTQQSRSFDREGKPLGVLRIDHRISEGTCTRAAEGDEDPQTQRVPLPDTDRVANVPLNLLFDPLVKGEAKTIDFQVLLCGGGPRLMDFHAKLVNLKDGSDGNERLVEVRYGPAFGAVASLLARSFVPKLSFWFDPDAADPWLGHRMPLYSDGPEVFVVRQGVAARSLTE
jgi:hypothetical protein